MNIVKPENTMIQMIKTIKAIKPKTLGLVSICLVCLASILFFATYDSSPKLSSTSKETGLQSVEEITRSLPEKEAEEFSAAMEGIEAGMDLFVQSVNLRNYGGKLPGSEYQLRAEIAESAAFREKYENKIWAKLDGQSVKQLISLGEKTLQWRYNYRNCVQAVFWNQLLESDSKTRGPRLPSESGFKLRDPMLAEKRCMPTKPELGMPDVFYD